MSFKPIRNTISSKSDLEDIARQIRDYRYQHQQDTGEPLIELFRGQGRDMWKLQPNIARKLKDVNEIKKIEKEIIQEFNDELVHNNLTNLIQKKFLKGKFHEEWLLIEQAQHFKIPTRFMDWTGREDIALFFAVSDPNDDIYDGEFWIYLVPIDYMTTDSEEATYYNIDPFEFNETLFLSASSFLSDDYPLKSALRRAVRQNGKFLIQNHTTILTPLQNNPDHIKYLHRIIIPKAAKNSLRNYLTAKGLTKDGLYVANEQQVEDIVLKLKMKYGL